ncbi:hypothetical protein BHM03_00038268 [Ensete ventricosum]|nr:hypothetical protein BHM03_00038268 [Ensete ventricosum]
MIAHRADHNTRKWAKNRQKLAVIDRPGERRIANEATSITFPAIRMPHLALYHLGGSRVLRWLTLRTAHCGHAARENGPKTGQNGPFLVARASSERRTVNEAKGSTFPAIRMPHPDDRSSRPP